MHVRVIGGCGAERAWARSGSLLVDGRVAFDSGGLASQLELPAQAAIDHVLLTHAHLDHIGELAFLADNVMAVRSTPLQILAPEPVLDDVRRHLFNNRIWPDFSKIRVGPHPVVEFCPLELESSLSLGHLEIRWVRTNHPVYSVGYLVEDAAGAVLYTGDTGPTDGIWQLAGQAEHLHAVFVETAFPDRLRALATSSGHLTPALLHEELEKLASLQPMINVMHVKPVYFEEISRELETLRRPWKIITGGETFDLQ